MEAWYSRNLPLLSEREQAALAEKHVLVVGCGGLGGYLCEYMVRLGVGEITAVDGDSFAPSNLNRQILCTGETLSRNKAAEAKRRAETISAGIRFHAIEEPLSAENAETLTAGKSLVLDGLDNAKCRLLLGKACAAASVPLIHGAIQGWNLQIATVMPGSGLLELLYTGAEKKQEIIPTLSFVPAYCAAIQAAEAARLLCGREPLLAGRLLLADLETMEQSIVPLL